MKRYVKEGILLGIQLLFFYIYPLFMKFTGAMGLVLILLFATFVLGILMGVLSRERIRYFFPAVIAILFIPSVFIYYNESALVHGAWYFIVSLMGLLPASLLKKLFLRKK